MAEKKQSEKKWTLEEAFARIEEKIEALENPDLPLEKAFQDFQEGMELVKYCDGAIDRIEKKVLKLTKEGETEAFD